MTRLTKFLLIAALAVPALAIAEPIQHGQFGVADTFGFHMYGTDGTLDVTETDGGTDVTLMCDNGAPGTATNDFTDEGSAFSIALTAAEMECAVIEVHVASDDGADGAFFIHTWGDLRAHDKGRGTASGTAQASTSTTLVMESDTAIGADDILIGQVVCITEGTGQGQCRLVTDFANATDTLSVSTWDTTPSTDSGYVVLHGNQSDTATFAAAVADAVHDESTTGHTSPGTFGAQLKTVLDANNTAVTSTIPGTLTAIQLDAEKIALAGGDILSVTDQTNIVIDSGEDPGINDIHIGRIFCVKDEDDADVQDCSRITDYDTATDTFTLDAAMDFTVAPTDDWWIMAPSRNLLEADEIDATIIAADSIGDSELKSDAFDSFPLIATNTAIATLSTQATFTISVGSTDDDAYNGCGAFVTDLSTPAQKAYAGVQDYDGGTKGVTLDADPGIFTMQAGDLIEIVCMPTTTEFMNKSEVLGTGNSADKWRGNP